MTVLIVIGRMLVKFAVCNRNMITNGKPHIMTLKRYYVDCLILVSFHSTFAPQPSNVFVAYCACGIFQRYTFLLLDIVSILFYYSLLFQQGIPLHP